MNCSGLCGQPKGRTVMVVWACLSLVAVLERECVLARQGERTLQTEKEALTLQLRQNEQAILELRVKHDQLLNQVNQEKVWTSDGQGTRNAPSHALGMSTKT